VPVEIKSGATLVDDFFTGLRYWLKLAGASDAPAALVYGGEASVRRQGIAVYSWADLWRPAHLHLLQHLLDVRDEASIVEDGEDLRR
jgi:hypothetical protein